MLLCCGVWSDCSSMCSVFLAALVPSLSSASASCFSSDLCFVSHGRDPRVRREVVCCFALILAILAVCNVMLTSRISPFSVRQSYAIPRACSFLLLRFAVNRVVSSPLPLPPLPTLLACVSSPKHVVPVNDCLPFLASCLSSFFLRPLWPLFALSPLPCPPQCSWIHSVSAP